MIQLSIVIPYYNTYELTERLLNSLVPQLNNEVEVIVVDDGCNESRLDKYAESIRIIHLPKNGGVSVARNVGIKESRGKYMAFIDSDDIIIAEYVTDLLSQIAERRESVIVFNWLDLTTGDVVRHPQNPAVWKAIYEKSIIPLFDETLRVREDYFFQLELADKQPSVYFYDRVLYIYNSNREGSLWWNETHK